MTLNFSVFPLFGVNDGKCECGDLSCAVVGKHVYYDAFATLAPGECVQGPEGCNYAIRTGKASGVFVVDCDNEDSALWFLETYEIPDTLTVRTGRGYHFYFAMPAFEVRNAQGALREKVDIRGEGGWVVAPDSVHRTGARYEIVNTSDPSQAPAPLLAWLQARLGATEKVSAPSPQADPALVAKATLYLLQDAPVARDGGPSFFETCQRLIHTYRLEDETALSLVKTHYNPRCLKEDGSPYPWSDKEILHKLTDARENSKLAFAPEGFDLGKYAKNAFTLSVQPSGEIEGVISNAANIKRATVADISTLLGTHPAWDGVFKFNVLARTTIAINPPFPMRLQQGNLSNGDLWKVKEWLACPPGQDTSQEAVGFSASSSDIADAIQGISERTHNCFNPIVDYLEALPAWDGYSRLDRVHDLLLCSPDGPVASSLFKRHLVAAVRRARSVPAVGQEMTPVDHQAILTLCGAQDAGKTRLVKALAINPQWYLSISQDVRDPEQLVKMRGKWLCELEEMTTARKSDRDALKAFISASDDFERAKYARSAEAVARSFVLFGTANELAINDPTGMRRFWCIRVGDKIYHGWLTLNIEQLWSEANYLSKTLFDHHPSHEEKEWLAAQNEDHFETDDPIAERLEHLLQGVRFVTIQEAYLLVMQNKADPVTPPALVRTYADALRRIGCYRIRNEHVKGWRVPDDLASREVQPEAKTWLSAKGPAQRLREKLKELSN